MLNVANLYIFIIQIKITTIKYMVTFAQEV